MIDVTKPSPSSPIRLYVPRHLQDCNGYCGPACVMMVHSSAADAASAIEAQHHLFRRVREHAKQANDRRPVKSPAESLLAQLQSSEASWKKIFHAEPAPIAAQIVGAIESAQRPCLLLVSKGMHWVVAFGRTLMEDGSVAGLLLRDPAWAGMPKFFGLTIVPEKPTFTHSAEVPCHCLSSDNPPGSVHERYFALDELLSPRGLQGSPDWEGKGALALVPEMAPAHAALPATSAAAALKGMTPQEAALHEAREHGLVGRPDSPPNWQAVIGNGQAGPHILVKDPDDVRDDFLLVPIHPKNGLVQRSAWIMLDPVTLRLREASLLDHWMLPAFPTDQDASNIANNEVNLPDGTRHRFKKSELRPNQRNLVWQACGASILPYWPLREFLAPHPTTGESTSIYVTQHGEIHTVLGPEETPATQPVEPQPNPESPASPSKGSPWKSWLSLGVAAAGIAVAATKFWPQQPAVPPSSLPTGFTTARTALPPPTGLQASLVQTSSARISWSSVPGASSYRLVFREPGAETWRPADDEIVQPHFVLEGLKPGTKYETQAITNGPGGPSGPSVKASFQTSLAILAAPHPLTAVDITTDSALITWGAVPGAISYKLEYKEPGSAQWSIAGESIGGTKYQLSELKQAAAYQIRAFTKANGSTSEPTPAVTFQTKQGEMMLPPPDPLQAVRIGLNAALISWGAVPGAISYRLDFKEQTASQWTSGADRIAGTNHQLTGLKPGTTYEAMAYAQGRVGLSKPTSVVNFKTLMARPHVCLPPTGLTATLGRGKSEELPEVIVTVRWNPAPHAVSYKLELLHSKNEWAVLNAAIKDTSYVINDARGIQNSANAVRVTTNCADGTSLPSEPVTFTRRATLLDDTIKKLTETQNLTPEQAALLEKSRATLQQLPVLKNPLEQATTLESIRGLLESSGIKQDPAPPLPQPEPAKPKAKPIPPRSGPQPVVPD